MATSLSPGDRVQVRFTKYDGGGHWEFDAEHLGCDEHGAWVGGRVGTPMSRPGAAFVCSADWVMLLPHASGFVASFNAPVATGRAVATYVDITTVPRWSMLQAGGAQVTMVDLDLDVIELFSGEVYVDDEDEFAEHRVAFGYPADLVATAEADCAEVLTAVTGRAEPFGAVGRRWLATYCAAAR